MKKNNNNDLKISDIYNEEYFERGVVTGVSGYMNYGWMPELTMRMAHFYVTDLPIKPNEKILDFGCAKGYMVKSLRLLGIEAYGVDISEYAISNCDSQVRKFCEKIDGLNDPKLFRKNYNWLIAKDVFEHISEFDLRLLLKISSKHVDHIFAVIPLAADDSSGKYIVPEYDFDKTHIVAKTKEWWIKLFLELGWKLDAFTFSFKGCKENWTSVFPEGNGFFVFSQNKINIDKTQ